MEELEIIKGRAPVFDGKDIPDPPVHGLVIRREYVSCRCRAMIPEIRGGKSGRRDRYDPIISGHSDFNVAKEAYNKAQNHFAPFTPDDEIGGILR